ncbi:TonB-dependent receptor [Photobacterium jeanii]|uniref:TonB-dependent receptor n=2 Tax=Photobacterium jeanii TaxID=858640 RepID=A0A178K8T6_9GAMM|nr:TonB-dependent receptor [Photobacterium jeanii]PST88863.1 TonB-dependent receptor [Photobacterium jeanii]
MSLSLDELSNVEATVTSAAKKTQNVSDVPAAIYVISSEQIKRSGVRSIADALALAPGVEVNKISEYNWQVSLRGLNETLFNKLLVMVDGRSVFSPLMSGTFWHTIDMVMDDIDRIEILRGTAGTMWGGNATNGVINIISKDSRSTLGQHFEITAGNGDYRELSFRHGFSFGDNATARVFVKGVKADYYSDRDEPWRSYRAGYRSDHQFDDAELTFQFGGYHNVSNHYWEEYDYTQTPAVVYQTTLDDYSRGGYLSLDWSKFGPQTDYEMYVWADSNSKVEPSSKGAFSTINLDGLARHRFSDTHELTSGAGVRFIHRDVAGYDEFVLTQLQPWGRFSNNPENTDIIYNAFAQLESKLSDKVTATLGAKVEHFSINNSTELQPQARIMYQHSAKNQFWAGLGRAVVTPSSVESLTDNYGIGQVIAPVMPTQNDYQHYNALYFNIGNPNMKNESVVTLDIGHRFTPTKHINIDSTIFYSHYRNLRMLDGNWFCAYGRCADNTMLPNNLFVYRTQMSDELKANTYGFETAIRWQPTASYTLNTSYSFIQTHAYCESGSQNPECKSTAKGGYRLKYEHQPAHFVSIQSLWSINASWQFDIWLKHKSSVESDIVLIDGSKPLAAPEITTVDVRLAWQQKPSWPRVEFIVDAFGKQPYSELPKKARVAETVYIRSSWDF